MSVSKTATNRLVALWESGVPLDSAWIEFTPFLDSFAIRALRTHPANDPDTLARDPRYKDLCKGWLPRTWEDRRKKLAITTKNERIRLLGEIYAGNLSAIGFRTLPSGSDELVRIPRQHFFFDEAGEREQLPDIHWNKGELTVGGTSYFDIRIVRALLGVERGVTSTTVATADPVDGVSDTVKRMKVKRSKRRIKKRAKTRHPKKGGRRNTSREIVKTTRELLAARPELLNWPVKLLVPLVRATILGEGKEHDEQKGYKNSSMLKRVGHELNAFRKRNKRNKRNKAKTT
jgi:hypothetical protein